MEELCTDEQSTAAMKKIEIAHIDKSEILPVIQNLIFDGDEPDLCLLQLNPDLLNHVTEGNSLTIRGNPDETTVICTDSATYELREAETSNSMLLVPNMLWPENCSGGVSKVIPKKISRVFHTYFEVRSCKPNFKKLRAVLKNSSYKGNEYEDSSIQKYKINDLLEFIQSSEAELVNALDNLQTCIIDGYVRLLDFDYKFNVLCQIFNLVESKSWIFSKVPKAVVVDTLQDLVPRDILEKCFAWFSHETDEVDENGNMLFSFDEDSVCRMYGEILLQAAGKFHLDEFLESWRRSVPEGMTVDLNQLKGIALTDMNYRPEVIYHFPALEMPENVKERFAKLFKAKDKWTYDEIFPYLEDCVSSGNDVKSLLIKYTRESTKNGVKVYSAKWG